MIGLNFYFDPEELITALYPAIAKQYREATGHKFPLTVQDILALGYEKEIDCDLLVLNLTLEEKL